jgi:ATP-dependent DNA helicase RecQ
LKEHALQYLRLSLNDSKATFRKGQWETIETLVGKRKRVLLVQRTGWGKSIVYFLATRLLRDDGCGPTLLISPLLALMRNQIEAAQRIKIRALTVNSSNRQEWKEIRNALAADEVDVLLISPERLSNDEFLDDYLLPVVERIGLVVVDEAHCISDWGHDFRPDYRRISRILELLPENIPVLGTTATANDRVVNDAASQLGKRLHIERGPLARESLHLQNIMLPDQASRLAWLAEHLPCIRGSGIIYALTIRDAERVAEWLRIKGIEAKPYHSKMPDEAREANEQHLLKNTVKALVATTALGMGFDKPDLGFVIHFQRPGSVVHYYQQVGRAGRAVEKAFGVLLCGEEDDEITEYFIKSAYPPEARVGAVLQALDEAEDGLSVPQLEGAVNLPRLQIEKVLKALAVEIPSPIIKRSGRWYRNPVDYNRNQEKIDKLIEIRLLEQRRMQEYVKSRTCLMAFLARELNDPSPQPCGKCAICKGAPIISEEYSQELVKQAIQFLQRWSIYIEPRKQWPKEALPTYGFNGAISPDLQAQCGRALCLWGDPGWADLVKQGKHKTGRFSDELVQASANLITKNWKPDPFPKWLTCVPSMNQPDLVPDFARRLAGALGLTFAPCIKKTRPTGQQKEMENSFHQARNLDGAFQVVPWKGMAESVLLIDDMVVSRWTFTVVAALLRNSGSGPVFPFSLAMTSQAGG